MKDNYHHDDTWNNHHKEAYFIHDYPPNGQRHDSTINDIIYCKYYKSS